MIPATVWLAGLVDFGLGEPRYHPVRLLGALLNRLAGHGKPGHGSEAAQRKRGTACWGLGLLVTGAVIWPLAHGLTALPAWLGVPLTALALKPAFSIRALAEAGTAVLKPLETDDLAGARQALGTHLVSRHTADLGATAVAGAAVASLAENLNDSVVAPLFWALLLGLPGAWLWRYVNTADAMWGYRDTRWLHFGRTAARADDLLGWLPARLSGLLIWMISGPGPVPARLRRLPAEARRTPSPNGGWPMAAFALRHDLRLEKPGVYVLHAAGRSPGPDDLRAAVTMVRRAGMVAILATGLALGSG